MVLKTLVDRDPDKYHTIIGVDSSSTGVAWTMLDHNAVCVAQGKIRLNKLNNMNDKLKIIHDEWSDLMRAMEPSHVFIEKSIFVANPATARTLSYVVGSIMCITLGEEIECTDVEPATWKSFLGYHNLNRKFVAAATAELGKGAKKFLDGMRKSQTWRVIKHNFPDQTQETEAENDNDIADSWGIALYGYDKLVRQLQLEKSKEVSLDLELLSTMGLEL